MCTRPNLITMRLGNKKILDFIPNNKEENYKLELKRPGIKVYQIPCGHCAECRLKQPQQMTFRAYQESKEHKDNIMLTLTYNDENIPKGQKIDKKTGEVIETNTLNVKDIQLFHKKLRKKFGNNIKFLLCGEYGTEGQRPHYHAIYFGLKIPDLIPYKKSNTEYGQHVLYKSKIIDKLWNKGFVDENEVNYETISYVAGYVTKKYINGKNNKWYEEQGLKPPYVISSKNFGKTWYENNKEELLNGKKKIWTKTKKGLLNVKPGRYFDKLMKVDDPKRFELIQKERKKRAEEILATILNQTDMNIDEYRQSQDILKNQKLNKIKRA